MRYSITQFCTLFLILHTAFATEIYVDLKQPEDWQATHDVRPLTDSEEGAVIECTGSDPYITSKALNFSAKDYKAILIEMSVSAGSQMQVFWASKQTPRFIEPNSVRAQLKPDGLYHTYVLSLAAHPKWTGDMIRLRLDPSDTNSKVVLRSFKIVDRIGPRIEPVSFRANRPFARPGEPIELTARIRNSGDVAGTIDLSLHGELKQLNGTIEDTNRRVEIPPGSECDVSWNFSSKRECAIQVSCDWKPLDFTPLQKIENKPLNTILQVSDTENRRDAIVLNQETFQVIMPKTDLGYGPARFQVNRKGEWKDCVWMARLGTVQIETNSGEVQRIPLFSTEMQSPIPGTFLFQKTWTDPDSRQWSFTLEMEVLSPPLEALHFTYSLQSEGGRLLHFSGPELFIGERSFGREKDRAIFPGIEFLDRDAVSSSDAVARPPVRDQTMPHPYKNTIPFMALTHENTLVSLLWPPQMAWSRNERCLSPKFSVPNRLYGQDNHLFGLFVPTVPDYTLENHETAHTPYIIQPGETVRIECAIVLGESNDPCDALDAWLELYGRNEFPLPAAPPRRYEEEIILSRQAYLTSCWSAEGKGWGHCVGWDPIPSGGMLALLSLDDFLTDKTGQTQILKERIDLVYQHILKTRGPAGLVSSAGCHVMTFEPAFYWGVLESALSSWARQAAGLKNSQNPDGSWGFHPSKDVQKDLGKEGEVVSGTIAPHAMRLMRLARITADPVATETGLKALEALNRRTVPRGAQGWECPLAAADIMVSGYGARANLDAYRITGDKAYLDHAVYWARTGIVFHYLWNLGGRPLQRYATIPIFGTTFFSHSWLGVPVQWCGLVYAYALQELAEFDDRYPWLTIAEGIVNSAMHQQLTEGELIGTLPDSYGDYFITARGAYINPENIMTNVHALNGNSLNIRTVFLDKPGRHAMRVSANSDIDETKIDGRRIQFSLTSKPGRETSIVVAPLEQKPKWITINPKRVLKEANPLFGESSGWRYLPKQRAVLIRAKHKTEQVSFTVERGD